MKIDVHTLKVNLIINFVRDYFTLKKGANVGVLYDSEARKLHIVCNYDFCGENWSWEIDDLLEEEDIYTMSKMMIARLKTID